MINVPYMAGILDANGIFRIRKADSGTELPAIFVHGLSIGILNVFGQAVGTKVSIIERDYPRAPCADHCTTKHQHIVSTSGRWSVTGAKATVILWNIIPHLQVQTKAAEEVLQVGLKAPRKGNTIAKMTKLGWSTEDLIKALGCDQGLYVV